MEDAGTTAGLIGALMLALEIAKYAIARVVTHPIPASEETARNQSRDYIRENAERAKRIEQLATESIDIQKRTLWLLEHLQRRSETEAP